MKIFLTGGTGFIGSHVVKELSSQGHAITVLARNVQKVPALAELAGVKIIRGDVGDAGCYKDALKSKDALIHIALHWGDSAVEMLLNDTRSSVQLFELAAKAGINDIIYTSSTAVNDWVYMDNTAREQGELNTVYEYTKQNPVTYYGATKGSAELYLRAIGFNYKIRTNIVRPGYTFDNPAVQGADTESDTRFKDIVARALKHKPIEQIKNDGTQFIAASDLAKIYTAILGSDVDNKMYFGLGNRFITWEKITYEALSLTRSKSKVVIKDLGWPEKPALFDVGAIHRDFNLSFDSRSKITDHLNYLMSLFN
jgi:UDP-glucose 4-epimerase